MKLFTSKREKKLWICTFAVILAIYSTLTVTRPIASFLRSKGLIVPIFMAGMLLVLVAIVIHGLKVKIGKAEIVVWLGIIGVYLLVLIRMSIPEERTHLIEYSIVALFIHEALNERNKQTGNVPIPAILALIFTAILGAIDEGIQAFLPSRVFDPRDILFNTLAALMAIGGTVCLAWARKQIDKKRMKK